MWLTLSPLWWLFQADFEIFELVLPQFGSERVATLLSSGREVAVLYSRRLQMPSWDGRWRPLEKVTSLTQRYTWRHTARED